MEAVEASTCARSLQRRTQDMQETRERGEMKPQEGAVARKSRGWQPNVPPLAGTCCSTHTSRTDHLQPRLTSPPAFPPQPAGPVYQCIAQQPSACLANTQQPAARQHGTGAGDRVIYYIYQNDVSSLQSYIPPSSFIFSIFIHLSPTCLRYCFSYSSTLSIDTSLLPTVICPQLLTITCTFLAITALFISI